MRNYLMSLILAAATVSSLRAVAEEPSSDVVPVPDEINAWATIRLEGRAGLGQRDDFAVTPYFKDENGNMLRDGSFKGYPNLVENQPINFNEHSAKLNEDLKVRPGNYIFLYNRSLRFLEIKKDQKLVIKLSELKFPRTEGTTYKIKLFTDFYTDIQARDTWLQFVWGTLDKMSNTDDQGMNTTIYSTRLRNLCRNHPRTKSDNIEIYRDLCKPYSAEKYDRSTLETEFKFQSDGSIEQSYIQFESNPINLDESYISRTQRRRELIASPDADFVSLLPGTYGVEFEAEDGVKSVKTGIKVGEGVTLQAL